MKELLLATGALALMTVATEAATMKAVYTGTVAEGSSTYGNVFGTGTSSLDGLSYVLTFLYDTSLGKRETTSSGADKVSGGPQILKSVDPVLSATLTINGNDFTLTGTRYSMITVGGDNSTVSIQVTDKLQNAAVNNYAFFDLNSTLGQDLASIDNLAQSFEEVFSDALLGYFYAQYYDRVTSSYTAIAEATLRANTLSVTRLDTPAAVPLPATVGLLAAALGGLGVAARRRQA